MKRSTFWISSITLFALLSLTIPTWVQETSFASLGKVPTSTPIAENASVQAIAAAESWLMNDHKLPNPANIPVHVSASATNSYPSPPTNSNLLLNEAYPAPLYESNLVIPSAYPAPNESVNVTQPSLPNLQSSLSFQSLLPRAYLPIVLNGRSEVRVFVIAYLDVPEGRSEFPQLLEDIRSDLSEGSKWHGVEEPALTFNVVELVTTFNSSPTNSQGNLSFQAVFDAYGLCTKIANGTIDQVWLFNPGNVPNPVEFAVNGNDYGIWNYLVDMPNCGPSRPMFTFVYVNRIGNSYYPAYAYQAVHSFAHYVETLFWYRKQQDKLYCDFIAANGRIPSYREGEYHQFPSECSGNYALSNQYGFSSLALSSYGVPKSVCGDVHFPPNITAATSQNEYKYNRTNSVQSICNNWMWGQNPASSNISCSTWNGCTDGTPTNCPVNDTACAQKRYLIWWLQHIPSVNNNSMGRNGVIRESWWNYLWR